MTKTQVEIQRSKSDDDHSLITLGLIHRFIEPNQVPKNSKANRNGSDGSSTMITIDGHSLSIEEVVLSSLSSSNKLSSSPNPVNFQLTNHQPTLDRINASLQFMLDRTKQSTYGVTTGFGAAATTRTHKVEELQVSIVEHLLGGATGFQLSKDADRLTPPTQLSQPLGPNVMSESIVRAAMLVRANSLARGHSAVRIELLEGLINLLNLSITPIIPLRGTISASGDLSPLAYIAGALCGHPDVYVIDRSNTQPKIMSSAESLKAHGIHPLVLGPKEGLAIANGTAISAAAASIAIYNAHILGLLSQVLTAMMTEAMVGQIGAFHPFIHQTARPHPGQIEVANNIRRLLQSSKLLDRSEELDKQDFEQEKSNQVLRQDRYPLRTAPQWIGPQLEDLVSAHKTLFTELNSTTDNPLVDVENGIVHHGGNFQATSVATSMEKTRLALAAIGKIMFAQTTELNNAYMNKGLPSCLNGHEPSTNYHTKGLDTICAGYCAELQYLASPVTTHVQSAEGHNQSINSLAFVSARKTLEAIEVLKLIMASHLYIICQALDLRVFEMRFQKCLEVVFTETLASHFSSYISNDLLESLTSEVLKRFWARRESTASLDSPDRVRDGLEASVAPIIKAFDAANKPIPSGAIEQYMKATTDLALKSLEDLRAQGLEHGTVHYLGGARPMYEFVRSTLGISSRLGDVATGKVGPTIGGKVDKIFHSFQFLDSPASKEFLQVLSGIFGQA